MPAFACKVPAAAQGSAGLGAWAHDPAPAPGHRLRRQPFPAMTQTCPLPILAANHLRFRSQKGHSQRRLVMKRSVAAAILGLSALSGAAHATDPKLARSLAATCANCHNTDGRRRRAGRKTAGRSR